MRGPAAVVMLLALSAPAGAVDQASSYPGCAEREARVAWGGAVEIDLAACQSFGLGVLATAPAHGHASPSPDAPAERYVYVHDGSGPAGGGDDRFVVLDDNSDRITLRVRVAPPTLGIALAPDALPALQAGATLDLTLAASGGQAPYAYSLADGMLPAGLALADDGRLAGAPTRRGPYAFTLLVRDARGAEGRRAFAGEVAPGVFALAPVMVAVVSGQAFEVKLSAGGGVAPHRFALEPGHALPPGVTLSADGWLRGVSATTAGDYGARVRVTDASTGPGDAFEVEPMTLRLVSPPAISLAMARAGGSPVLTVDRGQALAVPTRVRVAAQPADALALPAVVLIPPGERVARLPLPAIRTGPDTTVTISVLPGPGYAAGARVDAGGPDAR